jgi:hypothetical protein
VDSQLCYRLIFLYHYIVVIKRKDNTMADENVKDAEEQVEETGAEHRQAHHDAAEAHEEAAQSEESTDSAV